MSDYTYYNNLNDQELLELVYENYYSIGATGIQAMETLLTDIIDGMWVLHGVPDSRMNRIAVLFTKELNSRNVWNVVAGAVTDEQRKKGTARLRRSILMRKR